MTEAEIIAAIRKGIREPGARTVSNTQISAVILRAAKVLGLDIKQADPSYFNKRRSVSSNTHVFSWPTDCVTVLKVWDLGTTAGDVGDAANASPIVITETAHARSDDDIVVIHDVGGNTAANGTWKITYIDADSYSLDGSTGNGAYTSGGKVYKDPTNPTEITKIELKEATLSNSYNWYPRERTIVVDDNTFTNDILLDYAGQPDSFEDIPSDYHDGLTGFGVIELMVLPKPNAKDYADKAASLAHWRNVYAGVKNDIKLTMNSSSEPSQIQDVWGF